MPTLLEKGMVKDKDGKVLNPNQISIDYLLDYMLKDRVIKTPGDKVWLLESATGSGKSTVLPPKLFLRTDQKKTVICTQPRVYNTTSIPKSIVKYNPEFRLGENLGYSTSTDKVFSKVGLKYVTSDTLLAQMKILSEEKFVNEFSYIIVDEVHVRSPGVDTMFFKLKQMIARNYKDVCPTLILMSATFDIDKFAAFFGSKNILKVEGESYPINDHYLDFDPADTVKATVDKIIEIHENMDNDMFESNGKIISDDKLKKLLDKRLSSIDQSKNDKLKISIENEIKYKGVDILIFVSGVGFYKALLKELKSRQTKRPYLDLYVAANTSEKVKPIVEGPCDIRRIIFGTNAVETGVTIESLKYLIEPGWQNSAEYYPNYDIQTLVNKPVSRGAARQRRGRVGRMFNGECYFIYTKEVWDAMVDNSLPDILISDIAETILYILIDRFELNLTTVEEMKLNYEKVVDDQMTLIRKGKKSNSLDDIDMLDSPSGESTGRGMEKLHQLGILDKNNIPTITGILLYKLSRLRLEARKTMISGISFNVSVKDLTIFMCLIDMKKDIISDKKVFRGYDYISEFGSGQSFHDIFLDSNIHLLIIYFNYRSALKKNPHKISKWCEKRGINHKGMIAIIDLAYQMFKTFDAVGFNWQISKEYKFKRAAKNYSKTNDYEALIDYIRRFKMCIYQGHKRNILTFREGYPAPWGKKVSMPPIFGDPKHILHYGWIITEQQDKMPLGLNGYSVMSGFIGVDDNLY